MSHQVPKHFTIQTERDGETALIRLCGEFDLAAEEHFDRTVERLPLDVQAIVIDLSELTFIDSSGLRALLRVWKASQDGGPQLAIVPGHGQVRHTMALTGSDRVLPIADEARARASGAA